jgi:5'-3' exonuclease
VASQIYSYGHGSNPARQNIIQFLTDAELERQLFDAIGNAIISLIHKVQPKDTLIIAVDGVAPLAKMNNQKRRRYKTAKTLEKEKSRFNPVAITPGTDFMYRLDEYIKNEWIRNNRSIIPNTLVYSSHLSVSEGEHKIFEYYRKGFINERNLSGGVHVINGLDADLIMLSLISPVNNIYLMREDIYDVVNINELRSLITELMNHSPTAIPDFVVLSYLLGNDFIPTLPIFEDMKRAVDTIIDVYNRTARNITTQDGKSINWTNLRLYLTELGKIEVDLLKQEAARSVDNPYQSIVKSLDENGNLNYSMFRYYWYQHELGSKVDGIRYDITGDMIGEMCGAYLMTIGWIFNYYLGGIENINTGWFYKFFHPPLVSDLVLYMEDTKDTVNGYDKSYGQTYYNVIYQLLAVIPPHFPNLIPERFRWLVLSPSSPIYDLYPRDFIVDQEGKDREGIALVPPIDMDRIVTAVDAVNQHHKSTPMKYYQEGDTIIELMPTMVQLRRQQNTLKEFLDTQIRQYRRKK